MVAAVSVATGIENNLKTMQETPSSPFHFTVVLTVQQPTILELRFVRAGVVSCRFRKAARRGDRSKDPERGR